MSIAATHLRLFFAIDFSVATKNHIGQTIADLSDIYQNTEAIHWMDPKKSHITLQFLGTVASNDISHLCEQISHALNEISIFNLLIGPVELFPSTKHPKFISLKVSLTEQLLQLVTQLKVAIQATGYPTEQRAFHPHVTLGKFKHHAVFTSHYHPFSEEIVVNEVILFQSVPNLHSSHYQPLKRFSLKA